MNATMNLTLLLRRPASTGFLFRRVLALCGPLVPGSRRHIVATCRAELEWAEAEWRRLNPGRDGSEEVRRGGRHPAEYDRLPHEVAAARVVNCHLHLHCEEHAMRHLIARIPGQRRAAEDCSQSPEYRASWRLALEGSLKDLAVYRSRLRPALIAYRNAVEEYQIARALVDAPTGAPAAMREAA